MHILLTLCRRLEHRKLLSRYATFAESNDYPRLFCSYTLQRARINFFVDTYFTKVNGLSTKVAFAKTDAEAEEAAVEVVNQLAKEVEPLLADAAPYFGGSKTLTLAEVSRFALIELFAVFNSDLIIGTHGLILVEIVLPAQARRRDGDSYQGLAHQDPQLLQVGVKGH